MTLKLLRIKPIRIRVPPLRLVRFLIRFVLRGVGFERPFFVVGVVGRCEPVVCGARVGRDGGALAWSVFCEWCGDEGGERGKTNITPAFSKVPPSLFGVFGAHERGLLGQRRAGQFLHDLHLRPDELYVFGGGAVGGVRGVGAADVGHFGHHVAAAVFAPEGDADVLHAVA